MRLVREVEPFSGASKLPDPPPHKKRIRYAPQRPFPAYRYVPGSGLPHPVNDPAGSLFHAGGAPAVEPWTPHIWPYIPDWLYGVDLFNHWYFWEAHEAWEGLWQVVDKTRPPAVFVQSLIQLSAALLKVHLGSVGGATGLWSGAQQRLTAVAAEHKELMGLRPKAVLKAYTSYFAPLRKPVLPALDGHVPLLVLDL